jgi:hypothetical protein
MYLCGYFALLNCPNWEFRDIIPIFGVILVKIWVFDTPGVTLYYVTTCYLAMHFEEILTCFVINMLMCIFCIIKRSKLARYGHNTTIWGHFFVKLWGFDLLGWPYILCYHLLFGNFLWRNHNMLCPMSFCGYLFIKRSKLGRLLHNINIWVIFYQNLGIGPPALIYIRLSPTVWLLILKKYLHALL